MNSVTQMSVANRHNVGLENQHLLAHPPVAPPTVPISSNRSWACSENSWPSFTHSSTCKDIFTSKCDWLCSQHMNECFEIIFDRRLQFRWHFWVGYVLTFLQRRSVCERWNSALWNVIRSFRFTAAFDDFMKFFCYKPKNTSESAKCPPERI